jgi:hypothetical protein
MGEMDMNGESGPVRGRCLRWIRMAGKVRILALVVAVSASVCTLAAPASAARSGDSIAGVELSAGINVPAHSVTTRAGTVLTGVTFVDPKDLGSVRRRQRATTADDPFYCASQWYYIHGGGTNTYWRTNPTSYFVQAIGNRNADYWNQEYLPCWYSDWDINAYMFLSNMGGLFLHFGGTVVPGLPTNNGRQELSRYAQAHICYFDGNWTWIYGIAGVVSAGPGGFLDPTLVGPLNGTELFKPDPSLPTAQCSLT